MQKTTNRFVWKYIFNFFGKWFKIFHILQKKKIELQIFEKYFFFILNSFKTFANKFSYNLFLFLFIFFADFCASFLKVVTKHLLQRTQRAIQYCERIGAFGFGDDRLPRQFVFSGGVACNEFIYKAMREMVEQFGFQSYRCSKRLCTDNGVMIAWNGIEQWQQNAIAFKNLDINSIVPDCFASLGINHTDIVAKKNLKCDFVKVPSMERDTLSSDSN